MKQTDKSLDTCKHWKMPTYNIRECQLENKIVSAKG